LTLFKTCHSHVSRWWLPPLSACSKSRPTIIVDVTADAVIIVNNTAQTAHTLRDVVDTVQAGADIIEHCMMYSTSETQSNC